MARKAPPPTTPAAAGRASPGRGGRRWGAALAVAVPGSALAFLMVFGSTILLGAQDLAAWRSGMAPLDYLRQHGGWHAREAQARLEAGLHAQGLVASLVASDWGITRHVEQLPPSVQAADLSADGQQVVTSDSTRAFQWQLPAGPVAPGTPLLRAVWGAHSAAAAPDIRLTGWGYGQVAWLGDGAQQIVALATRGQPTLWFHAGLNAGLSGGSSARAPAAPAAPAANPAPRPLAPRDAFDDPDGLAARGGALVLWNAGADRVHWLPDVQAPAAALAHTDVALAAWALDGSLVTASRGQARRWRGSRLLADNAWAAEGQPVALSDDGAWAVVQISDERLTLMATAVDGPPPAALQHDGPVRPACACGPWVVTGGRDGRLHVWQHAAPGEGSAAPRLVRQWQAYVGPVNLLVCRGERLLSAGRSGLGEDHALVWDLAGRPQPVQPPPPGHDQVRVAWTDSAALALGLGNPAAADLVRQWRAQDDWLAPAGVGVWLLTLVGAGWLLRRR